MKFRLTGISTPIGGLSWDSNETGKKNFKRLLLYLESKRILVNPTEMEKKEWCIESVIKIKDHLISITEKIPLNNEFDLQVLRALIDTCNCYLDTISQLELPLIIGKKDGDKWVDLNFDSAMKTFRNGFRLEIKKIEDKYKLHFTKNIPKKY